MGGGEDAFSRLPDDATSLTTESVVVPVGGFEAIELCQVLDVKPLESDSLGTV